MQFFALFVVLFCQANGDTTLKLVNVLYRHGDRSPITIFPTDPNREDKWPQGPGWLTPVKVFSSDISRCLMSAYCNLAGMFPPGPGGRQFNDSLNWQPIPVHTRPTSEDNTLSLRETCPRYQQLYNESFNSPAIRREEAENKDFYEWLGQHTGVDHENIDNIWEIADTVFIEKTHNMTLAPWINETVYEKLRDLIDYNFVARFNSTEERRLKGGPLLKEFIENIQNKIKATNPSSYKMHIYSAHDTTVAVFLETLEVFNRISPPYAAMVIMELHQSSSGDYSVKLFYKNSTTDSDVIQDLAIPNCEHMCPLDKFIELTKPVVPVDWFKECAISQDHGNTPAPSAAGMTCFACSDVTHLKYCDHVKRCQPNEICYVSKSQSIDGRVRYNSGCTSQQQCMSVTGSSTINSSKCLQCCSADYCNQAGCGDQGFSDRAGRGPLCLDCNHVGNVTECDTVRLCSLNQACKIEEFKWGNDERLFKLGCEDKQICALGTSSSLKRSAPLCANCCDEDFCNKNCTTGIKPAIIG